MEKKITERLNEYLASSCRCNAIKKHKRELEGRSVKASQDNMQS